MRQMVYNACVRLLFSSFLLPLWGIPALMAMAQESPDAALKTPQPESQQAEEKQTDQLVQILDDMAKTQDEDFYAAASYVLEQTGDELAFHKRMKELAKQEHPVAMYWLARSLQSGESPYQDEQAAALFRELILKSAAKDYLPAMVRAAQTLYNRGETEADRSTGMNMLVRACKMGSAKARACYLVMSGLLVDKDSDLNAPEIATELKHRNFYVEEIVAEAHWDDEEWLRIACEHGSAWAAYELALRGHLRDEESVSYLRMAAERHMQEAMTTFGCLLCLGSLSAGSETALPEKALPNPAPQTEGDPKQGEETAPETPPVITPTPESIAEGLQLLRKAASMGDERAAAFTALAYAGGAAGEIAPERIAALFRFAHEQELPYGTAGWGYCLVAGKGCEQDVQQGLNLLLRMAAQGVAWADLALSHLYKEGFGVDQNAAKAAEHRKKFEAKPDFPPFIPTEADADFFPALR